MRAIIYFICVVLFVGCEFGKVSDNKINSSDTQRKDLILSSLRQTNPTARKVILEVIDTVEFYKSRLSVWPDSAVCTIIDKYKEEVLGTLDLKDQSSFSNIIHNDTMLFNSFSRIMTNSENDYSDKIVLADFELIGYQYLNKKYTKIIKKETLGCNFWEQLQPINILGDNYISSIDKVVTEFIFNESLNDFDEYDLTLYNTNLAKIRFYQLTNFFSVITNSQNFKIKKSEGYNVDSIFELATLIYSLLQTERDKYIVSENINSFYSLYRELHHFSSNMESLQKVKYDIFMEQFCDLQYNFLLDVKKHITKSKSYKQ